MVLRRWWRAGLALGCADAALIALEIAAAALVFMQCCAGGPSRDRGGGGRRPPAPIVEVAATAALPAEGVPPSIVLDGAPSPRRGSSLVPTQGVRTGYLAELETLARRLPYPLDAVESDGSLRIVPSFEALTCADVCEHVVLPMTAEHNCSVCELLQRGGRRQDDGRPLVGTATRLVSYAWSYLFVDFLSVLRSAPGIGEQCLWIDMLVCDQHQPDGVGGMRLDSRWLGQFQDVVRSIGHTVVVLDSWRLPVPPTRAWCCLEGFVTASVAAKLEIVLPPAQRIEVREALLDGRFDEVVASLCPVDVTRASASNPQDVDDILALAAQLPGGAATLSSKYEESLRQWLAKTGMSELSELTPAERRDGRVAFVRFGEPRYK